MRYFRATKNETSLDDLGMSGITFRVQSLERGKVYKEHIKDNKPSGYVIDDNSCWNEIGSESFNSKFEEVTDEIKRENKINKILKTKQ